MRKNISISTLCIASLLGLCTFSSTSFANRLPPPKRFGFAVVCAPKSDCSQYPSVGAQTLDTTQGWKNTKMLPLSGTVAHGNVLANGGQSETISRGFDQGAGYAVGGASCSKALAPSYLDGHFYANVVITPNNSGVPGFTCKWTWPRV